MGPEPPPPSSTAPKIAGVTSVAEGTSMRSSGAVARLAAIALACLVGGFIGGWFLRGGNDGAVTLPPVSEPVSTTAATTAVSTATTPPAPPELPEPATISLAVLNGTTISGFAAKTAGRAQTLGYRNPSAGNTPTTQDPTTAYFRPGKQPAAQRVAKDLGVTAVKPLPTSGPVATSAPAGADVVLVLGSGTTT